jgi:hypothetical protein
VSAVAIAEVRAKPGARLRPDLLSTWRNLGILSAQSVAGGLRCACFPVCLLSPGHGYRDARRCGPGHLPDAHAQPSVQRLATYLQKGPLTASEGARTVRFSALALRSQIDSG